MGYSMRTGRLIAVLVLLAGLLGMHVLGLHGTSEHHGMSETAVTHAMTDAVEPMHAEASTVVHSTGDHGSSADGMMAALCVLALLAGILLLRPPALRGGLPLPAVLPPATGPVPARPEQPSLDVLCISRR